MNADIKREFARMVDARNRLVDMRGERMEQLLAVRAMFRVLLADFFETLDPITNLRLAEVTADGSKSHGDLAIALSFFEGTRLRLAVDIHGQFTHGVSIPSAFDDVERVVEIRVSPDLSRAEIAYEPVGSPGTFRSLDLIAVAMHLLDHAMIAVEAQLPTLPPRAQEPMPVAPAIAPRVAASLRGFSPRPISAVRPSPAASRQPIETEPSPAPKSDVLTLRLG